MLNSKQKLKYIKLKNEIREDFIYERFKVYLFLSILMLVGLLVLCIYFFNI